MKNIKRVLAIVLMLCMVLPLACITSFADGEANWTLFGGKFSASTGYYNRAKLAQGYTQTVNEDGSITVHSPTGSEYGNTSRSYSKYDIATLTNETVTTLDNLSVTLKPGANFSFLPKGGYTQSLNVIWTTDHLVTLQDITDCGSQANVATLPYFLHQETLSNGLRSVILNAKKDETTGVYSRYGTQGIMVTIDGSQNPFGEDLTASRVNIYKFDGSFFDANDGAYGYRWCFTPKNFEGHSPNGDGSPIYSYCERIDCTDGVTVEFVPDTTLGYKVFVNGKDFSDGKQVGYFPMNTKWSDVTEQGYLDSMTYAREDIDLTSLVGLGNGYLTVGATGVEDVSACKGYDFDLVSVNGVPAAQWAGEANTHVHNYTVIKHEDATCVSQVFHTEKCDCGAVKTTQYDTHTEVGAREFYRQEVLDIEKNALLTSAQKNEAMKALMQKFYETQVLHLPDHEYSVGYFVYTEDKTDTIVLDSVHGYDNVCKLSTCVNCGDTKIDLVQGEPHVWGDWAIDKATGDLYRLCDICEEVETATIPSSFEDAWTLTAVNFSNEYNTGIECDALLDTNEDGALVVMDPAAVAEDPSIAKFPLTKVLSKFSMPLNGFSSTFSNIGADMNDDGAVDYNYALSLIWTNKPANYSLYNQFRTYAAIYQNLSNTMTNARYGWLWDNYVGGEFTVSATLLDCLIIDSNNDGDCTDPGEMRSGVLGDNYYDSVIITTLRNGEAVGSGSFSIRVAMADDITVGIENGTFTINGYPIEIEEYFENQLTTNTYYFGVASYGITEGDNVIANGDVTINREVPTPCSTSFAIKTINGVAAAQYVGTYETGSIPGVCDHVAGEPVVENEVGATCQAAGSYDSVVYCDNCGAEMSRETIVVPAVDHEYEEVVVAPTGNRDGSVTNTCKFCGDTNSKVLPMTCDYSSKNYTLTIKNGQDINLIRFAPGVYTTSSQIKAAPGLVTVSAALCKGALDADGNLNYDVPDGGVYSFYVRYNTVDGGTSGPQYIFTVDFTNMVHELETFGLQITVKNLYGVKDFFIAAGHHTTYREVKNAGYITQVTPTKFGTAHSYTYPVDYSKYAEEYTVLIRHTDATKPDVALYYTTDVIKPEVSVNGLQVTVSNLERIKCIRSALGSFSTASAVKNAAGVRNFTNKCDIKGADVYTISYNQKTMQGVNTLSIEYMDGYTEVIKVNIQAKAPELTINGNSITFSNIDVDDLYIIRWAPGKVSTPSYFKTTTGNKYTKTVNPDGTFTIEGLTGKWSFMVQYNEGSQNIYTSLDFGA